MRKIFISHAHQDRAPSDVLVEWLIGEGWPDSDLFVDFRTIPANAPWQAAIDGAPASARVVIFLASGHSLSSSSCRAEIDHAQRDGTPLIVALLEEIVVEDPRLDRLRDRQMVALGRAPEIWAARGDEAAGIAQVWGSAEAGAIAILTGHRAPVLSAPVLARREPDRHGVTGRNGPDLGRTDRRGTGRSAGERSAGRLGAFLARQGADHHCVRGSDRPDLGCCDRPAAVGSAGTRGRADRRGLCPGRPRRGHDLVGRHRALLAGMAFRRRPAGRRGGCRPASWAVVRGGGCAFYLRIDCADAGLP